MLPNFSHFFRVWVKCPPDKGSYGHNAIVKREKYTPSKTLTKRRHSSAAESLCVNEKDMRGDIVE